MSVTFEQIQKANESIVTTDVKGNAYAPVNQRIKAFRMVYPGGGIITELLSNDGEDGKRVCVMRATVLDEDGKILGNGTAYEKEGSTYINKTSYLENCESSCIGRALGMAGFGIDTSIASAEEVVNAIMNQKKPSGVSCSNCGTEITDSTNRAGELWEAEKIIAYSKDRFNKPLCPKCIHAALKEEGKNKA